METIIMIFNGLFPDLGSKGILAIGIPVGFFVTRRILQNHKLSLTDYLRLIGIFGGGGGMIGGLVSYLLEKKLFAFLDAYSLGLFVGFVFNILLRILAAIIKGVGHLLMIVAKAIERIAGAADKYRARVVESIKVFFRHFF